MQRDCRGALVTDRARTLQHLDRLGLRRRMGCHRVEERRRPAGSSGGRFMLDGWRGGGGPRASLFAGLRATLGELDRPSGDTQGLINGNEVTAVQNLALCPGHDDRSAGRRCGRLQRTRTPMPATPVLTSRRSARNSDTLSGVGASRFSLARRPGRATVGGGRSPQCTSWPTPGPIDVPAPASGPSQPAELGPRRTGPWG